MTISNNDQASIKLVGAHTTNSGIKLYINNDAGGLNFSDEYTSTDILNIKESQIHAYRGISGPMINSGGANITGISGSTCNYSNIVATNLLQSKNLTVSNSGQALVYRRE